MGRKGFVRRKNTVLKGFDSIGKCSETRSRRDGDFAAKNLSEAIKSLGFG